MTLNKLFAGVIVVILAVILVFTLFGNTAHDLQAAADEISYPSNCSDYGNDGNGYPHTLTPSVSTTFCTNTSNVASENTALIYTMPLQALFVRGGIVLLLMMAGVLLLVFGLVRKFGAK